MIVCSRIPADPDPVIGRLRQGLPPEGSGHHIPTIRSEVIKLRDLESRLPPGVQRIGAAERGQSLEQRQAAYQRRFVDR